MVTASRPDVPVDLLAAIRSIMDKLPETHEESAWVGTRWRVSAATIGHVFGGEDQLIRIVFRATPDEVLAFEHLGAPYFKTGWGHNHVGMILDEDTDWDELAEMLVESYRLQAPQKLAALVAQPEG